MKGNLTTSLRRNLGAISYSNKVRNFWKGKWWKRGLITRNMIRGTWVEYPRTRTFNGLRDTCCGKTRYRWGLSLVARFLRFKLKILLILLIRESRLCFLWSRDLCDLVGKPMQWIEILLGVTNPLAIGAMRTSTPSTAISSTVAAASSILRRNHGWRLHTISRILILQ